MMRPLIRPGWLIGAGLGVFADRLLGELPASVHPLVHFGNALNRFEASFYRDDRRRGIAHTTLGTTIGIVTGRLLRSTTVATYTAVGGRSLGEAAVTVGEALIHEDLTRARSALPSLVGRDPTDLDAPEIARATVESVAENTVDSVVAPVLWAALCGPAGALGYRAVNTMDAMVGHHSARYENYGWASARLDDVVNWIPARCTAALVALVRPRATIDIIRGVATQAPLHPSPNSGVGEVAFAAALGVRLGGRNRYGDRIEERPPLGYGRPAKGEDIDDAVRVSRDVSTLLAVILLAIGATTWLVRR
ncbi:MAG: adenosylcobinamide-phosphate synthase CbiB [Acidimicrobiales bacterium]